MRKLQKFCLGLAAFLSLSFPLSACAGLLPPRGDSEERLSTSETPSANSQDSVSHSIDSSSSSISEESFENNESEEESSSTATDSENDAESSSDDSADEQAPNKAWETVDALYQLRVGEYLEGTYTLTGRVTKVESKRKAIVYIVVEGRENKPIQCYDLQGTGAFSLSVGDIITVSGRLCNYEGIFEFDEGCQLLAIDADAPPIDGDPYPNTSKTEFYASYTPASNDTDAYYRSLHGFLSGDLTLPDQAPVSAKNPPKKGNSYIRNEQMLFSEEGNAYTVVNEYGEKAFTVYRSGGYITLEEVAAYVYAFGTYPPNYVTSKNPNPENSIWGEYLRGNHSAFSGSTSKYPYEPKLPNISGCGGTLNYYEMDIGTTGTDCDPINYPPAPYNDGHSIDRGAARIVYGKTDLNGNGVYEIGEFHLFYTYNHYNDFQEYLNYQGGWGEMFGNITGGGTLSSKTDYNPTPYVEISFGALPTIASLMTKCLPFDDYTALLAA